LIARASSNVIREIHAGSEQTNVRQSKKRKKMRIEHDFTRS
jgi:hypothetical protein